MAGCEASSAAALFIAPHSNNNPTNYTDPSGNMPSECGNQGEDCNNNNPTINPGPDLGLINSGERGGRLLGQPGNLKDDGNSAQEVSDDPSKTNDAQHEGQDFGNMYAPSNDAGTVANVVGLGAQISANFTYNILPNLQSPSWYGSISYDPLGYANPITLFGPGGRPTSTISGTYLYNLTSATVRNESSENISINYISSYKDISNASYNPYRKVSQIFPSGLSISPRGYGVAGSGLSTSVTFPQSSATVFSQNMSIFVNIYVRASSGRWGGVTIKITP